MLFITSFTIFRKVPMKNYSLYFYLFLSLSTIELSMIASEAKTPFAAGGIFSMKAFSQNFHNASDLNNQTSELDQISIPQAIAISASFPVIAVAVKKRPVTPVTFADENEDQRFDRSTDILKDELLRNRAERENQKAQLVKAQKLQARIEIAQKLESPEFQTILSMVQMEESRLLKINKPMNPDQKENFLNYCKNKAKDFYLNNDALEKDRYVQSFGERRRQHYNGDVTSK